MKITPLLIISTFHCLSKASGLNTPESKVGDALRPKTDGAESSQSQSHEQIFAKTYDMQSPNHHRRMGSKARKSKAKSKKRHPSNPTHTSLSDDNRDPSTRCEMLAESIGKQSLFERRLDENDTTTNVIVFFSGIVAAAIGGTIYCYSNADTCITGAIKFVASEVFGLSLGQLGLDFWNTSSAERDQAFQELQDAIGQISNQIEALSSQLTDLSNLLLEGFQAILDAIGDSQEQIQITIWIANLNKAVSNILGLWDTYQVYLHLVPSRSLQDILRNFSNDIISIVPSAIREINEALLGSTVSEGLIPLVARVSFRNSRCIYEYAETMFNLIGYYTSVESIGLYLMIEAYNFDLPVQIGAIEQYYNIWQGMVNNQIEMHNSFAPMATVVADREFSVGRVGGVAALTVKDDTAYTLSRAGTLQATSLSGTQMSASTPLDLSGNDRDQVVSFIGAYKDVIIVSSQQMSADPAVVIIQEFTQAGLRPRFSIRREDGSGGAVYATGYDFDVENGLLYILERLRRPGNSDQHKIVTVDVDAMQVMSEVDVDTFSAARGLTIVGSTAVICKSYHYPCHNELLSFMY